VDGTVSGSCPIADFDINGVESSGSVAIETVSQSVSHLVSDSDSQAKTSN
jgi:hypothetical protein